MFIKILQRSLKILWRSRWNLRFQETKIENLAQKNHPLFIVHFPIPDQIEDLHVITENRHVTGATFASCSKDTCVWQEYVHLCTMSLLFDGSCVWFGAQELHLSHCRSWIPGFGGPFIFSHVWNVKRGQDDDSWSRSWFWRQSFSRHLLAQAASRDVKRNVSSRMFHRWLVFGVVFRGKNVHEDSCWLGSLGPGPVLTAYVLFDVSSIWFGAQKWHFSSV